MSANGQVWESCSHGWIFGQVKQFATVLAISWLIYGQYMASCALFLHFSVPKWLSCAYGEWYARVALESLSFCLCKSSNSGSRKPKVLVIYTQADRWEWGIRSTIENQFIYHWEFIPAVPVVPNTWISMAAVLWPIFLYILFQDCHRTICLYFILNVLQFPICNR